MRTLSAISVLLSLFTPLAVRAQHNAASLTGTWSSSSGAVVTGSGFANPVNFTFTYPKNTGISWSFTDDGYFEQAEYFFTSNGTQPTCITGTVLWQHGKFTLVDGDNSTQAIIADPFAIDGRLQVQDPCAAKSNTISQFNTTVTMKDWAIYQDPERGEKLQLFRFDGAPLNPMYRVSTAPNMLPTQTLTVNLTFGTDGQLITNAATEGLAHGAYIVLGTMIGVALGGALLL